MLRHGLTCALLASALSVAISAQASVINAQCSLTQEIESFATAPGEYIPMESRAELEERYVIDPEKKSVTLLSRTGTRYSDPKVNEPPRAINDGIQYFTDIRVLDADMVIFCTDGQAKCERVQTTVEQGTGTGEASPTIISLRDGQISYSTDFFFNGRSGQMSTKTKTTGTCRFE